MLRKCVSSQTQITDVMIGFIDKLKGWIASRLDGLALPMEVMGFARNPFKVALEGDLANKAKEVVPSIDEGKFMLELVDLQSSVTMAQELHSKGPAGFWCGVNVHQFPNISK